MEVRAITCLPLFIGSRRECEETGDKLQATRALSNVTLDVTYKCIMAQTCVRRVCSTSTAPPSSAVARACSPYMYGACRDGRLARPGPPARPHLLLRGVRGLNKAPYTLAFRTSVLRPRGGARAPTTQRGTPGCKALINKSKCVILSVLGSTLGVCFLGYQVKPYPPRSASLILTIALKR